MITRRRLFLASGLSLGATLAAARAAAFQQVEIEGPVAEQYAAACSGTDRHARIVARIEEALAGSGLGIGREEIEAAVADVPCPLCGCALAAAGPPLRGEDRGR